MRWRVVKGIDFTFRIEEHWVLSYEFLRVLVRVNVDDEHAALLPYEVGRWLRELFLFLMCQIFELQRKQFLTIFSSGTSRLIFCMIKNFISYSSFRK